MSKIVDVYRHPDNDGDVLTPKGVAAAMALGEALEDRYSFAVSTGAQRATQALACAFSATSQTLLCGVIVEHGLRSQAEDRWKRAVKTAGDARMSAVRAVDADLVDEESAALGRELRIVLDRLSDGSRALVMGHSPTNEAAILGLTGEEVESMGKGAGIRVLEDGGAFRLESLAAPDYQLRQH